jgi:tetratricopeptide (TPR) repeat protein
VLLDISNVRSWMDDIAGAERAAREAVSIYRETVHERHPDRVMADYHLARVWNLAGRTTEAAQLYESTLASQRLLYGDVSTKVGDTLTELANVRINQNQLEDAEKLMSEALQLSRRFRGATHHQTGYILASLAQIHWRLGNLETAEKEIRSALDIFATTLPTDHQYVAAGEYVIGEILLARKQFVDAEAMLTASMHRWKRSDAPQWRTARSASALGEALYRQGRIAEAEKYLLDGYRDLSVGNGADQQTKDRARSRIAAFYVDTGQREKLNQLRLVTTHDPSAPVARPN